MIKWKNTWYCYKRNIVPFFSICLATHRMLKNCHKQILLQNTKLWLSEWCQTQNFFGVIPFTLFRMGIFGAAHGWEGPKRPPLPKICHTYPTVMKLGTVIPYLKKIWKIYESRGTPWVLVTSAFIHRKSANFVISRNIDIDCILVHSFYFVNFSWVLKDFFDKPGFSFEDVSKNCYPRPS